MALFMLENGLTEKAETLHLRFYKSCPHDVDIFLTEHAMYSMSVYL